jgi:6-phosphogluconolactonase (cycloisomerase 2 family)/environmental stress-induced protein Ves
MSLNTANLKSFSKPYATASLVMLAALLTACGGGGGGGSNTIPPPPQSYTIGGSVSGLTGTGLTLQDNGGNNLQVAAGATSFVFSTAVQSGAAYAVTVLTQPSSPAQTCTVTGGSGTVAASNITSVSIACVTGAVTVGGTISGLTGSGLVLQDNGGDNLTVAANATTFTFATPVKVGAAYAVTVLTQPSSPAEVCTVTGGSGTTTSSNVTTVSITCTTATVTVGGTITGLAGSGLVLQDNGGDNLTVAQNATTFTFATPVGVGAAFSVSVLTQPSGPPEVCTVTGGTGTAGASNVTSVVVSCVPATFTVGGTITGLTGTGLVLQDNSADNLTVAANATTFTFATALQVGAAYAVSVATQPTNPAQVCTVGNGSGTIGISNVTSVTLNCVSVGRYVYVVNSIDNGNPGDVAAFSISPGTGALTPIPGGNVTADITPLGIALDHTGQYAYVSNKNSSDVSLFYIGSNGALTLHKEFTTTLVGDAAVAVAPSNQYVFSGGYDSAGGGAAWPFTLDPASGDLSEASGGLLQTADPLTSIAVDPMSNFVYATTGNSTSLYGFSIGSGGNLTPLAKSPFNAPRGGAVAIWPLGTASGGYVYMADIVSAQVSGFSYDGTGNLTKLASSPYFTEGGTPTGITIDPAGTYLYVTNAAAGDASITSFMINPTSGALTIVGGPVSTGNLNSVANPAPVDVKVDPSNQYVYVVNSLDGSVSQFTVSAGVLTLKNTYNTGTGAKPVAIAIE